MGTVQYRSAPIAVKPLPSIATINRIQYTALLEKSEEEYIAMWNRRWALANISMPRIR
jgi:hypothetical protein